MGPTPHRLVSRRIVDLIYGLGPGAVTTFLVKNPASEGATASKHVHLFVFVSPILAPMLHHHGVRFEAVCIHKVHHYDMLQANKLRLVSHHVNPFGAPALVWRFGLITLGKTPSR